eukprot:3534183-Prymnesium_polylepis.1
MPRALTVRAPTTTPTHTDACLAFLPLQAGTSFYLLLRGKVSVSSSKMADKSAGPIVLTDGACFGEAGLVARVRREATVTAIADCLMLQLDACDVEDLNIDLVEMRIHVISQVPCRRKAHRHVGAGLDLSLIHISEPTRRS